MIWWLDRSVFLFINSKRNRALDIFYSQFYKLGKGWVFLPVYFVVYFFYPLKMEAFLLFGLLQTTIVKLLKYSVRRKRPASELGKVYLLERVYLKSFPSGDTAMAFYFAFFFFPLVPTLFKALLLVYALLIAYGRVYVGAHYPTDVIVGALIGSSCGFLSWYYKPYLL